MWRPIGREVHQKQVEVTIGVYWVKEKNDLKQQLQFYPKKFSALILRIELLP